MEVERNGDLVTFPMGPFFAILMPWLDFMKIMWSMEIGVKEQTMLLNSGVNLAVGAVSLLLEQKH